MRVVIGDDSALFRTGLSMLLAAAGVEVVAEAADGSALLTASHLHQPDVAIIDIRMPPTFTDEGLQAAEQLKSTMPAMAVVVLSTYAEAPYAARLLATGSNGVGYLLKDRVDDINALRDALTRVTAGECVIDPDIVTRLLNRHRHTAVLDQLTAREADILRLMAEGRSNRNISQNLFLSEKTIEANSNALFRKLSLPLTSDANRRVLAVLTWLRASG